MPCIRVFKCHIREYVLVHVYVQVCVCVCVCVCESVCELCVYMCVLRALNRGMTLRAVHLCAALTKGSRGEGSPPQVCH